MSGPKCAETRLSPAAQEALDKLLSALTSLERSNTEQRRAIGILVTVDGLIAEMRALIVPQGALLARAGGEPWRRWNAELEKLEQEISAQHVRAAEAAQAIAVAKNAMVAQMAAPVGPLFSYDSAPVAEIRRRAGRVRSQLQVVITEATEADRKAKEARESDRVRREFGRALSRLHEMSDELGRCPSSLRPKEAEQAINVALREIQNSADSGKLAEAAQMAKQRMPAAERAISSVRTLWASWNGALEETRDEVERASAALSESMQSVLDAFVPDVAATLRTRLAALEASKEGAMHPSADFAVRLQALAEEARALLADAEAAAAKAQEQRASIEKRNSVVKALADALETMDFNVGWNLADPANPLGDIVISGSYGPEEATVVVTTQGELRLNLPEESCAPVIERFIESLTSAGVEFELTDPGTLGPHRTLGGGGVFPRSNTRTSKA